MGVGYRTGVKWRDASALQMEKAPPLHGGALLEGGWCGGLGEGRATTFNMYAAFLGRGFARIYLGWPGGRIESPYK